mgnify:CR=1 FL=1
MKQFLFYISFFLVLNACRQNFSNENTRKNDLLLAEVKDSKFYFSDISKFQLNDKSAEDSVAILNKIIDNWIDEELFSLKAIENIPYLNAINFEADNYKRALISAAYEKQLLSNFQLDLTEEDLIIYYNNHIEFFVFEEPYYDINYILLPKTTKNLAKIKKAITDGSQNHWLDNYCAHEPEKCVIEKSVIEREIFLMKELKLPSQKLAKTIKYNYQYISRSLVMIYRINKKYGIGDVAPLKMVEKELTNLAMHKKKQDFLKEIKEKTIQKAKNDKIFEKHIN